MTDPLKPVKQADPNLCEDEGCEHAGTLHVCVEKPKAVPEGRPTPEMREKGFDFAAKWCNPEYFCEGEAQDMADEFAYALAAAAHKATLEAEAKVAAMREACAKVAANMPACPFDGPTKLEPTDPCPVCGDRGDDLSAPSHCMSAAQSIRALPLPTSDRFTWLLEALKLARDEIAYGISFGSSGEESKTLAKINEALAAFEPRGSEG